LPYILRILAPDVKPVVINTSAGNKDGKNFATASVRKADEKEKVMRAVECMAATGVRFEKSKVEGEAGRSGGFVYRMEPGLDSLGTFETFKGADAVVRYAVRQVLEGEWHRRRAGAGRTTVGHIEKHGEKEVDKTLELAKIKEKAVKRDFFGRMVAVPVPTSLDPGKVVKEATSKGRVWVNFHEGFSNAVRKPITIKEFMGAL
jgi:chromosome transmission fidelity protein 18